MLWCINEIAFIFIEVAYARTSLHASYAHLVTSPTQFLILTSSFNTEYLIVKRLQYHCSLQTTLCFFYQQLYLAVVWSFSHFFNDNIAIATRNGLDWFICIYILVFSNRFIGLKVSFLSHLSCDICEFPLSLNCTYTDCDSIWNLDISVLFQVS